MFRRVLEVNEDGAVTRASRGIVVGNCTTYSKAPEFVNMVKLLIGEATFNKGLDHYHTKVRAPPASTELLPCWRQQGV